MIRIILACFMLFLSINGFAQKSQPPSLYEGSKNGAKKIIPQTPQLWLNFSTGVVFPQGKYASAVEYERGGYAKTGLLCNIEAGYKLFKFGGLNLGSIWAYNTHNKEAFLYDIGKLAGASNFSAENNIGWQHFYCMIGPYITFSANNIIVDFGFKAGYAYSYLPKIFFSSSQDSAFVYQRNALKKSTIAYGGHFRLGRKIAKHWLLTINSSYIFSAPQYTITQESSNNTYQFEAQNTYRQPSGILNLAIGMTYIFRKKLRFDNLPE